MRGLFTKIYANPTDASSGGPHGDAGVTGRKITRLPTAGGLSRRRAFSGDPTKVDRSAWAWRYVAKNVVAAGTPSAPSACGGRRGSRCRSWSTPKALGRIRRSGHEIVRAHFKLTPRGIMDELQLRRPIYKKTAAFGHFGRTEPEFTWERTDKAAALRADAGL
jgi:S-adenosylmethionine synthetase